MTYIEAMQLLAAKSPAVGGEAAKTIRRLGNNTTNAQHMAERMIEYGLGDPQAELTTQERIDLAALLTGDSGETRNLDIRLRVTADEKQRVQDMADNAGLNISDFVRSRIGI